MCAKPVFNDVASLVAAIRRERSPGARITLVGMPGVGKTTLGTALASELGLGFIDSDEEIVRVSGRSIPEIFAADGEAEFRRLESAALADAAARRDVVAATGGGAVTRPENAPAISDGALVVWVRRPLCALATGGRPLSAARKLEDIWAERWPLYEKYADLIIDLPSR